MIVGGTLLRLWRAALRRRRVCAALRRFLEVFWRDTNCVALHYTRSCSRIIEPIVSGAGKVRPTVEKARVSEKFVVEAWDEQKPSAQNHHGRDLAKAGARGQRSETFPGRSARRDKRS